MNGAFGLVCRLGRPLVGFGVSLGGTPFGFDDGHGVVGTSTSDTFDPRVDEEVGVSVGSIVGSTVVVVDGVIVVVGFTLLSFFGRKDCSVRRWRFRYCSLRLRRSINSF